MASIESCLELLQTIPGPQWSSHAMPELLAGLHSSGYPTVLVVARTVTVSAALTVAAAERAAFRATSHSPSTNPHKS
jgi:hypothetical protein